MKLSDLFIIPNKSIAVDNTKNVAYSQQLLYKAGYIRQLAAGIFSYSHLALLSLRKIEQVIREEMNAINGVEINMPVIHPADVWKETNRFYEIDKELVRFQDRGGRDMVIAMTHEEVVASLAKSEINSYKQLPKLIYQIQTKFRDEARARGGLIRVREFVMKDSYSLDSSWEALELQYDNHYKAYFRMFERLGLPVVAIQSDTGMMGGKIAHEYMYLTDMGEDKIMICEATGYQANREVATFKKVYQEEAPAELVEVHTPGAKKIEEVAEFLKQDASKIAKSVFYIIPKEEGPAEVVVAVVPGHLEVNEAKLRKYVKAALELASDEEVRKVGIVPGFGSPVGLKKQENLTVIVDDLIANMNNYVMGANKEDYHLTNVCCGRDYEPDIVGDIVNAYEGAIAPDSESGTDVLVEKRGIEVGNIFQLGIKYTKALGATFMDKNGKPQDIIMGSYGIGVGRALGCIAEEYHDEKGLKLPFAIAPFQVHLIGLCRKDETRQHADNLYKLLQDNAYEVLYDDRKMGDASPGVKFTDADLIGIPIQIIISDKGLADNLVEIRTRDGGVNEKIKVSTDKSEVVGFLENLKKTIT